MVQTFIRPAVQSDYEAVASLNGEVQQKHADAYPGVFRPTSAGTLTMAASDTMLTEPNTTTLVVVDDIAVVGYISAEVLLRPETPYRFEQRVLYVHQIVVRRGTKRRGHGRRLMDAMRTAAMDMRISRIELDAWAFNEEARRFFAAEGYGETNVRLGREVY